MMSVLYGLDHFYAKQRSSDLLEMVGLLERKDQKVHAYSKGMKQRLILAMALINELELLFLDEPTGGLDVQSTNMILSLLRNLNKQGTTIFLTTYNMEEANQLCHRVGIIRNGVIIAIDAPEKLKSAIDREYRIEISFGSVTPEDSLIILDGIIEAHQTGDKWQIIADNKDTAIKSLVTFSKQNNAPILTLNTLAPTLDEAFIWLNRDEEKL
jgi:ABC-2 type transport system ATP-binding protein